MTDIFSWCMRCLYAPTLHHSYSTASNEDRLHCPHTTRAVYRSVVGFNSALPSHRDCRLIHHYLYCCHHYCLRCALTYPKDIALESARPLPCKMLLKGTHLRGKKRNVAYESRHVLSPSTIGRLGSLLFERLIKQVRY